MSLVSSRFLVFVCEGLVNVFISVCVFSFEEYSCSFEDAPYFPDGGFDSGDDDGVSFPHVHRLQRFLRYDYP